MEVLGHDDAKPLGLEAHHFNYRVVATVRRRGHRNLSVWLIDVYSMEDGRCDVLRLHFSGLSRPYAGDREPTDKELYDWLRKREVWPHSFDNFIARLLVRGHDVRGSYHDYKEPMAFNRAMDFVKSGTHYARRLFWDSPYYQRRVDCVFAFDNGVVHWTYDNGGGMNSLEEIKAGDSMMAAEDVFATDWVVDRRTEAA